MTDEQQYIRMTETPIPRLICSLSAPAVLSMLITAVYNMTDTYFVSKLGTSAAAAVGVVFALMSIIQSVGFTLGMGASAYISRFLGVKDIKSAKTYAASAAVGAAALEFIITVIGLCFLHPLMRLLGSTETALPYAADYAKYILIGSPLMCTVFVLNNILRAEGLAGLSMIGVTAGGIINIILDPLMIFNLKMGISGAALATLIGQAASFIILSVIFFTGKSIVGFSLRNISGSYKIYLNILKAGFPTLCRQGMASVASALLAVQARVWGDAAIAALTIANKIYLFVRNFVIGIGQGYQPMAGYNYGAGKYDRIKKGFWFTSAAGTAVCTVSAVLLYIFADFTVSLFRAEDTEVIRIGSDTLKYLCLVLPVLAYSTYVNQLLQCLGRSKSASFLAACRQGIIYIPLLFLLSRFMGLTGLEITQSAADFLTFAVSVPFQIHFFKTVLNKNQTA